jgi:hypothetical protein
VIAGSPMNLCPLCGKSPTYLGIAPDLSRRYQVDCGRCGRFRISFEAVEALPFVRHKHFLSYVCRTWPSDGVADILTSNIQALANRAPRRTLPEKVDWLLTLLAEHSKGVGQISDFNILEDYPLVTARDSFEAEWLLDCLSGRGAITRAGTSGALTMTGWERLDQLRQRGPDSAFAFVAMAFSIKMSNLFDSAIEPAVRSAGYEPIRVDRKEHANSIDDEIIGGIRKSRFMVADFTGQRAGVYFEAGMMTGLGRPVIWMCDKQELSAVHFDVRQRNFIDWTDVEDAKHRLYKRIVAIEGEGPNVGLAL